MRSVLEQPLQPLVRALEGRDLAGIKTHRIWDLLLNKYKYVVTHTHRSIYLHIIHTDICIYIYNYIYIYICGMYVCMLCNVM